MASRYWVGGGSSTSWSATGNTNWSATSGGAGNASVPVAGDNIFFDASSGVGTSVADINASFGSIDCTGYAGTLNITVTAVTFTGATVTLSAGMTLGGSIALTRTVTLAPAAGTQVVTMNGQTFPANVTIAAPGATVQLGDDFAANYLLTLTSGTFDANGKNLTLGGVNITGTTTRTLTMGSGTWTVGGPFAQELSSQRVWLSDVHTNLTLNANTSTVVIATPTDIPGNASRQVFSGRASGGQTILNNLTINADNSIHRSAVELGGNFLVNTLTLNCPRVILFGDTGARATIEAASVVQVGGGNTAPLMMWPHPECPTAAAATFSVASGTPTFDHALIGAITFDGGATFEATDSFDLGGNIGITITPPGSTSVTEVVAELPMGQAWM